MHSTVQRLGLTVLCAGLLLSCGDEEEAKTYAPPPVFGAIDPSMTCKPGYIGWDFATGGGIEALPTPMKIVSVDCDGKGAPTSEAYAGQSVSKQCQGATSCSFAENCREVEVKWKCGTGTTFDRKFPGGSGSLSCYVPGDKEGAEDLTATGGKACVPKTCPHNTFRNERLQCVTAFKRRPRWFAFGPPTAVPLQRTAANTSSQRLVGNTEYLFASHISVGRMDNVGGWLKQDVEGLPEGRLEFWFTDEYVAKGDSGLAPVQGFLCTAAQAYVSARSVIDGYLPWISTPPAGHRWIATRTMISPACTAKAASDAAEQDAARRATLSLEDFRKKYRRNSLRLHSSFDLEGQNILPSELEDNVSSSVRGCLPKPPGFFYHLGAKPELSYIDMISYYQQRELTGYKIAANSSQAVHFEEGRCVDPWIGFDRLRPSKGLCNSNCGLADGSGASFGTMAFESPTRARVAAKTLKVGTLELEVPKFGKFQPVVELAIEHKISGGDNPSNPYAFGGPQVSGVKSLMDRRLSADIYMHPATSVAFDPTTAIKVGSVALASALPTGTLTNGRISISRRNVRRFFSEWTGVDNFKLFYCIGADGLSTLASPQNLDLPVVTNAGIEYGAGVDADETDRVSQGLIRHRCVAADTVVVVHRDEARSPLEYAASSASFEESSESQTGDSNSQGSQGDGAEKSCSGPTCTMTQRSEMGIGGMFGSTIFDATANSIQTQRDDGSGNSDLDADAEVLGFSVLDMPEGGDGKWADSADTPKQGLSFSISPNWGVIEEAIDKALTGTSVEAESGRYGGRDGLGVAYGYKTVLTGPVPGVVNVGVSAGVGLSLNFEVKFEPEEEYPCKAKAGATEKCYMMTDEGTQEDALSECAKLGGYLAEARNQDDLDNIQEVLGDESGRIWVGAQQAYRYVGGSCAEAPDAACANNAELSYRWLSDRKAFATGVGSGALTFKADSPLSTDTVSFASRLPDQEGSVAYDIGSGKLVLRAPNEVLAGVCEFVPAKKTSYLKFAGGVGVGVAAGLGISFCTPSEDFGVCLAGAINFISLELKYEVSHETHTITKADDGKQIRVGGTGQDVPWSLKILAGEIVATLNVWLFSTSWTIVSWDGFKVAEGSLFETYTPVVERLQ